MIYDLDDNPVQSFPFSIESGEVKLFTLKIECRTNYFLRVSEVSDLTIEARKSGDTVWINLESSGIDLSPYNATRVRFEIRMTAATVSSRQSRNFKLTVGA